MERRWIQIESIHIDEGRERAPDMDKVRDLAASIDKIGLMNPPAVRFVEALEIDGEEWTNVPVLIAGHHRIKALTLLGRTSVECDVYDVSAKRAKLMEVDENLERAELGPAQERLHIFLHDKLTAEIEAEEVEMERLAKTNSGKSFSTIQQGPGRPKGFAAQISEMTGESKQGINRKLAEARALVEHLKRIDGTSLDKGVEIAALVAMPEPERAALIERAHAGEKVSARPADPDKPAPAATHTTAQPHQPSPDEQDEIEDIALLTWRTHGEDKLPHILTLLDMPSRKQKLVAAAIRALL